MKLLPFLQLAFAAAASGWSLPGSSFIDRRPVDQSVGLHLLRDCPVSAAPLPVCRLQAIRRPVTTLLLNYSTAALTSQITRQLLWIRCLPGMKSDLILILHDHLPGQQAAILWSVTSRGCRSGARVVHSNAKDNPPKWRLSQVDAEVKFDRSSLLMCSGLQLSVEDEWLSSSSSANNLCEVPAASRLFPKLSILLRKQQNGPFLPNLKWIHIAMPKENARIGGPEAQVRVDVALTGSPKAAGQILVLTSNCSQLQFSLAILNKEGGATSKLKILSSQPIFLDSPTTSNLNASVLAGLSRAELRAHLKRRYRRAHAGRSRYLVRDVLAGFAASKRGPLDILLRVSFGPTGPNFLRSTMPKKTPITALAVKKAEEEEEEEEAVEDLVTARCEDDGYVTVEIDSKLAKLRGFSLAQFSVKAAFCRFSAISETTWRLRFRVGDCGSLRFHDSRRSRVVFTNSVSLRTGARSKLIRSIKCVELMQTADQISLHTRMSHSPVIGENVSINFTSNFYADFNVLACGVDGGKFPIYNIYVYNQSVDNRLLYFDILTTKSSKTRHFVLRFKPDYPYGKQPWFKIYCLVEGCTKGRVQRRPADGLLWCSSGRHISRSKIIVAFVLLKLPSSQPQDFLGPSVHLLVSVCIAVASFALGVVTVFAACCLCRRRAPDHRVIRVTTDL